MGAPSPADVQPVPAPLRRDPPLRRAAALTRRHWLLAVLLAAGLVLRVLTQFAYRPALVYIDSLKYLYSTGGADPVGYWALLKPAIWAGNLDLVAAVQHVLGLAMAVVLYAVLLRRGVPRWLGALATAPVLLDGYQLQLEQTVMPDAMFEAVLVAAAAVLVWRRRPGAWAVVTGCLVLGASATVRQVGEVLILPALLYVAVVAGGWRRLLGHGVLASAAFALPILAYCSVSAATTGHFRLSYEGGNQLYGRLVVATGCARLALPGYERPLCPSPALVARVHGIDGLDHNPSSPLIRYRPPAGMTWSPLLHVRPPAGMTWPAVVADFTSRLLSGDPAGVARSVGRSALTLFAVDRETSQGDTPVARWQFQRDYPFYREALYSSKVTPAVVAAAGRRFGGGGPVAVRPLAAFLRAYQLGDGYTPGPLLAFAAFAGLAGTLATFRRRTRGHGPASPPATGSLAGEARQAGPASAASLARPAGPDARAAWAAAPACLLFFGSGVAVLLASDVFEFSWRYQLPALVTLPPAAALALSLLGASRQRLRRLPRGSSGTGGVTETTAVRAPGGAASAAPGGDERAAVTEPGG